MTVFFRLLLSLPHLVWLVLWSIAALLAAVAQWFVRSSAAHQRLGCIVSSPATSATGSTSTPSSCSSENPFPGFAGVEGTYPLDLEVEGPRRQNRWKTGFRLVLAIPAFLVNAALGGAPFASAVLTWFYALVKGSAPWGLRNLSAYVLRYDAQTEAYSLLLTDAYPHASPLEGDDTPVE